MASNRYLDLDEHSLPALVVDAVYIDSFPDLVLLDCSEGRALDLPTEKIEID